MDWKKFEEDKLLFLEGAFIAINQGDMESALWMIHAAEVLDKDNYLCGIAKGYMALHKLDHKEAERCFNSVLKKHPHNELAKTFLGLTYIIDEKKIAKGEKICMEIIHQTQDNSMKELATSALTFADHEMKKGSKSDSPFNLAAKKHNRK